MSSDAEGKHSGDSEANTLIVRVAYRERNH
jgi:hypothetical protein